MGCFGDCTPWTLDILYAEGLGATEAYHVDRPFSLTCCCFNRPTAYMTDAEGNPLGSLRHPWTCGCVPAFQVYDSKENPVLDVSGSSCQPGFWCPLPIGEMKNVELDITDNESGEQVGKITKKVPSAFKFFFAPDVDDYHIEFEGITDPERKALMIAMSIFLDFRFFNDNSNDDYPRQAGIQSLCSCCGASEKL